jgi:hypothetical protein
MQPKQLIDDLISCMIVILFCKQSVKYKILYLHHGFPTAITGRGHVFCNDMRDMSDNSKIMVPKFFSFYH